MDLNSQVDSTGSEPREPNTLYNQILVLREPMFRIKFMEVFSRLRKH
jgi:hypothetical protein